MKEVCTQTGLTERAVRFYVQEKLVVPLAQRRGGRTWLDFAPADVDRLRAISILRRAGFTLEGIRSMITDFSKNASGAAFALRQRLQAAYDKLRFTDTAQANGLEDYAALLQAAAWNPLVFVMLFVVIPLPIALVVGSKIGKWFFRHFEYIP